MLGALLLTSALVATAAPAGQAAGDRPYLATSVPVPDGCIVLGQAWAGVKVFLVQRRLGTGFENDRYGPATFVAVQKFQRHHHLAATGRVNRPTWNALDLHHQFCMDRFTVQPTVGTRADTHQRIKAMISWAKQQVGTRYVWGAAGSMGYDCSGLSLQAMYAGGRVLPSVNTDLHQRQDFGTATAIFESGLRRVPLSERKRGDLVFYGPKGSMTHMAIYLGNDRVVEAVRPQVQVASMWGHGVPLKTRVARPFGR